jgi:hypothetical protein
MLAAIEIHNQPRFEYRDEVFVILLFKRVEAAPQGAAVESGALDLLPEAPPRAVSHPRLARRPKPRR